MSNGPTGKSADMNNTPTVMGLPGNPIANSHDNGTGGQPIAPMLTAAMSMPPDARSMKAQIFSAVSKRLMSEKVSFFGVELEIRQPTIKAMLDSADDISEGANSHRAVNILLSYAYVPGTNQLVFDAADTESILSLPFGPDFNRVMTAFQKISGVNVEKETKNLESNPSASK